MPSAPCLHLPPCPLPSATTLDFTKTSDTFDFIFDAVGKTSYKICKHLLNKKGIYISTELGNNSINIWLALLGTFLTGKKVLFPIPTLSKEDVIFLKKLVEAEQYKPIIDRQYSLEQIVEAYRYAETGQKIGNLVIKVS